MKTIVLLFSGGIDSFIAYHYLKQQYPEDHILPLYIDYNGQYSEKEREVLSTLTGPLGVESIAVLEHIFDFMDFEIGEKCFIPNRNLHMAAIATTLGSVIMIGGLKDDNVGDKSPTFCKFASAALSQSMGRPIRVDSPFWKFEKTDIISWYIDYVGFEKAKEDLLKTTSCYSPDQLYCGECPSCFRKMCALQDNGIYLPFFNMKLVADYYNNRHQYPDKRAASIEQAYKRVYVKE